MRCLICGGDSICSLVANRPGTDAAVGINICTECGHGTPADNVDAVLNLKNQYDFFEDDVMPANRRMTRWPRRPRLIAKEVGRLMGSQGAALDIGCGNGLWLAALGERWQRYGVELSPKAAALANTLVGASIFLGPIETYIAPTRFQLITAFAVVEHITDPRAFVQWIYDNLRPGGLMVLMTGDRESAVARQLGSAWPLYFPTEHVHFFSARSLTRLVVDVGFEIRRKEWRYMPWGHERYSRVLRVINKVREIGRLLTTPVHDHFYLYAAKP